jgi:hypothetical protein
MTSTPDVLVVDHSDNDAEITLLGIRQAAPHATSLRLRDGDQALQFMFCRDGFAGRVPRIPQLVFLEAELPARHALDVLNELHLGGLCTSNLRDHSCVDHHSRHGGTKLLAGSKGLRCEAD